MAAIHVSFLQNMLALLHNALHCRLEKRSGYSRAWAFTSTPRHQRVCGHRRACPSHLHIESHIYDGSDGIIQHTPRLSSSYCNAAPVLSLLMCHMSSGNKDDPNLIATITPISLASSPVRKYTRGLQIQRPHRYRCIIAVAYSILFGLVQLFATKPSTSSAKQSSE